MIDREHIGEIAGSAATTELWVLAAQTMLYDLRDELAQAEAQLAAVPALVDALRKIALLPSNGSYEYRRTAQDALAEWEQAQGETT